MVEQNKGLNIQRMMKLMVIQRKKNQEMNIGRTMDINNVM